MGLSSRYESLQIAKGFAEHYRKIAVIVGTTAQEETQDSAVHGANQGGDVVAQRYRIRILGEDPPDKPENRLPVAYPLQLNSGLGAQSVGIIRYVPNTFVYVSKDPNSGTYQIEAVVPNFVRNLLDDSRNQAKGVEALSGFVPGSAVPDTYRKGTFKNELFGTQKTSEFSEKEAKSSNTKTPNMPKACAKVNTAGVNDAIERLIQDVEDLKTGLLGEDSFLQTSQNFINDVQNFNIISGISTSGLNIGGEEYELSIGNAAQDISQIIAALMQEMRKFVIRKVSSGVNQFIGNVPLSTRYIVNETKDKALSALSCLFYRILLGLEKLVGDILKAIVDRILNAAECLVENILGGIIGEIIGKITGLINSILGNLSEVIGNVIDFTTELIDFALDILDLIKCPVENICPSTDKWDFLSGSSSSLKPLDFGQVFDKAKNMASSAASTVGNVTATFDELTDDWNFSNDDGSVFEPLSDINAGTIWQNIIDGSCDTGAVDCGPPKVQFFGGNGFGGAANAVVNTAGEILGVQILNSGNYSSAPLVEFVDSCGNGQGGTGTVIIVPKTPNGGGGTTPPPPPGGGPDDGTPPPPLPPDFPNGGGTTTPPPPPPGGGPDGGTPPPPPIDPDFPFEIGGVVITDPGYGYEAFPYGDKGGGGRVWANRCQTSVHRADYRWDIPYSLGQTVRVYYGDEVTLPGQATIVIDENFTEDMIPGCIVTGVNPKLKDMTSFDYSFGKTYETGIRHQFGFEVDAQRAFAEGYTEQDIRFFLENKFFLRVGRKMREKLLDPNWGKIPEFYVTFTAPGCPPGTPEDPNEPPTSTQTDGQEVVSAIDSIFVSNPGFGYNDGDQLLIGDGTNGSADLIIRNGRIIGANITNPGIGFTTLPSLRINTETGFNADLKPVLRFINPNDSGFVVPFGTPTLQVIDCVGKV